MQMIHGVGAGFEPRDLVAAGLAMTSFGVMMEHHPEETLALIKQSMIKQAESCTCGRDHQAEIDAFDENSAHMRDPETVRETLNAIYEMSDMFGMIVDQWEQEVHRFASVEESGS